jgi:hypothetical protein
MPIDNEGKTKIRAGDYEIEVGDVFHEVDKPGDEPHQVEIIWSSKWRPRNRAGRFLRMPRQRSKPPVPHLQQNLGSL